MRFREIAEGDVPELFAVRTATRENTLSLEDLAALGITGTSVREMIRTTHKGWLCEACGRVVGFAMGNGATGEMWVIAVLPEFEGRGIGRRLLELVEEWLWSVGWNEAWLTTDTDTGLRAYGFYRKHGWVDREIKGGDRYMIKQSLQRKLELRREAGGGGKAWLSRPISG